MNQPVMNMCKTASDIVEACHWILLYLYASALFSASNVSHGLYLKSEQSLIGLLSQCVGLLLLALALASERDVFGSERSYWVASVLLAAKSQILLC
jgi:hypothetical protein